MRNVRFVAIILIVAMLLSIQNLPLTENSVVGKVENTRVSEVKKVDKKALILAKYLEKYNSPLQYHAQDFVDAADANGLDWKLLPSIAGVESTFGKHIPGGYNAWGWGVYGNQALGFRSWKEGIFIISKGLKENYVNRGLTNPYAMNRIYAASPSWGGKVVYFMNDLDSFAKQYQMESSENISELRVKTAAYSGMLALKGI
ncbi:hypothetical protein A3B45_01060 [Candidatus Daviesbacteria bacterium RIFCSPLOWO2_01_FULL_39_12]|uniref:Mannosyl-glycoprotein endo-beta-N-acetylglucosamidase-like domain-containing protein n=1 Tax=Candidatus Daviesbacteria bacterium RIFCSPLOWO2_01_FULL_39_12 TaxID=1797785 RepID=A0A1F5KTB4_9BACT|nr:MAG: hypothetical protein A3D79_02990 [Candidatus Daviesbacteria bacterium RIFCSPHIGHO2_02_FULL_39_8]OGE44156.1 MAG: hypothetical protein A3B45_01060 [Candidatus Daviesbacteria bacterium RIFCSPLOWO2_01_FULL_39_12]